MALAGNIEPYTLGQDKYDFEKPKAFDESTMSTNLDEEDV
ncbi:hypothetical protein Bhyg_07753, partial [Pseudolycoriella hygida]